jgi:hypothetical protein
MKWRRGLLALAGAASAVLATGTALAGPAGAVTTSAGTMTVAAHPAITTVPVGHWAAAQAIPGLAALNTGGSARVEALSCATPGNCAAGGTYQDATHHDQVFAAIEAGGTWGSATTIPNLATLNAGGLADVTSVSCGEAGDCAIGGSYENAQHDDIPWVDDSVAGTWRNAQGVITTNLTSIDSQFVQHFGIVNSISCAVAGRCAAAVTLPALVTSGSQLRPEAAPYILTELNGLWGTPKAAAIVSSTAAQLPAELNSVSCAGTPTFCIAGGAYTDGSENQHAIVMDGFIDFDGDSWGAATELPGITALPGYRTQSPSASVSSVSCLPNGDCAASGFYTDTSGHHQVFTGGAPDGGQWSTRIIPEVANLNAGGQAFVDDMSCGAPGECAVAGSFEDSSSQTQAYVDVEAGGLWRNAQQILGINDNPLAAATRVSCAGVGFCVAGGLYRDNGTQAFVADENAGTWGGAQKIAGNLNVGGNAGVTAVSCTPSTSCTAGGFYTDAAGHQSGWVADDSTATTTTLSTSAFSVASGQEQQERITVTVAPLTGGTPTGTVTVSASGSTVCAITLSGGHGSCTLRAGQLPKGNYLLTANYGGNDSYLGSFDNSNKMFKVLPAGSATSTGLTLSAARLKAGHEQAERLSVHVAPKAGGTPGGKVTVKAGSVTLCVISLAKAKGTCRLASKKLKPGTYHLTASYPGSIRFAASTSPKKTLTVTH